MTVSSLIATNPAARTFVLMLVVAASSVSVAQEAEEKQILITNANVFDGRSAELAEGMSVLIEGDKIAEIGKSLKAPDGVEVIDAKGRTLTPGFIYAHEHLMFQASSPEMLVQDDRYIAILSTQTAKKYLDRGITTVRDAAGNS